MDPELVVIQLCLEYAGREHIADELRSIRDRITRLESQTRLLARAIKRRDLERQQPAGRTRPSIVRGTK